MYWNVTGNGWDFPIDQASASVWLPEDVPRDELTYEAYTGPRGSSATDFTAAVDRLTGAVNFSTTRSLGPEEGLTIVVGFPKGYVREPTPAEMSAIYVQADRVLWTVLSGLLVVLAYYLLDWFFVGRDPRSGVIYPLFEPPLGLPHVAQRLADRLDPLRFDHRLARKPHDLIEIVGIDPHGPVARLRRPWPRGGRDCVGGPSGSRCRCR